MDDSPSLKEARRICWKDLEADHPVPLLERRRVHGERMTVAHVRLEKGFKIEPHAHDEEQIVIVISGRMRFLVGKPSSSKEITVAADEILHVPSQVPHGAEALEDTLVLDLFSPAARATGIDRVGSGGS